jgi:rubrerythrin
MYPNYNMYNPNQYYGGFNDYNFKNNNEPIVNLYSEEIINLSQAIELIKQSVGDEREDELFYDALINQAQTEQEKEIIKSIRDDERKHNQILRDLYCSFTGQVIPQDAAPINSNLNNQVSQMNYKDNLEKALFGELNAVKKYRRIMGTMPSGSSYTLLMSIMTDELRHACKYNFLIHNAK